MYSIQTAGSSCKLLYPFPTSSDGTDRRQPGHPLLLLGYWVFDLIKWHVVGATILSTGRINRAFTMSILAAVEATTKEDKRFRRRTRPFLSSPDTSVRGDNVLIVCVLAHVAQGAASALD